jgi:hypothetical protein
MTAKKSTAKSASGDRVVVENVNHPGKTSTVDGAKYREAKTALLAALPKSGGLTQAEMIVGQVAPARRARAEGGLVDEVRAARSRGEARRGARREEADSLAPWVTVPSAWEPLQPDRRQLLAK